MPIDIAAVAATIVTSFLVPYAKAGLERIAQGVTDAVGPKAAEYAGELTEKVWGMVKAAFGSPQEQTTLELFRENPDEMQAMLVKKLQEKLAQDEQLAQKLSDLINKPGPDGTSTGAQIMHAGIAGIADLRGANLSQAQDMVIGGVILGDPKPSDD